MEPYLQITVEAKKLGQLLVIVDITPDNRTQTHRFRFFSPNVEMHGRRTSLL
jgi:hypothetical protein